MNKGLLLERHIQEYYKFNSRSSSFINILQVLNFPINCPYTHNDTFLLSETLYYLFTFRRFSVFVSKQAIHAKVNEFIKVYTYYG